MRRSTEIEFAAQGRKTGGSSPARVVADVPIGDRVASVASVKSNYLMKRSVFALLVIAVCVAGCHQTGVVSQVDLVGEFHPASKFLGGLRLDRGGVYFDFDFLSKTPVINNGKVVGEAVDGLGWIEGGTWRYADGMLILLSKLPGKHTRIFSVTASGDGVTITSTERRTESYKKTDKTPNQAPPPTRG
jgi:hypothetical protein